jgi:hypothetical protein
MRMRVSCKNFDPLKPFPLNTITARFNQHLNRSSTPPPPKKKTCRSTWFFSMRGTKCQMSKLRVFLTCSNQKSCIRRWNDVGGETPSIPKNKIQLRHGAAKCFTCNRCQYYNSDLRSNETLLPPMLLIATSPS